jgi:hypothetical protein
MEERLFFTFPLIHFWDKSNVTTSSYRNKFGIGSISTESSAGKIVISP